jgi:hypothetical protein
MVVLMVLRIVIAGSGLVVKLMVRRIVAGSVNWN